MERDFYGVIIVNHGISVGFEGKGRNGKISGSEPLRGQTVGAAKDKIIRRFKDHGIVAWEEI